MELKEGMYVRINNNVRKICIGIGKVVKIFNDTVFVKISKFDSPISFEKDEISDFKNNIIDLIEEGDYVNGLPVVHNAKNNGGNIVIVVNGDAYNEEEIKSILTKEQYENNCYKVDDK